MIKRYYSIEEAEKQVQKQWRQIKKLSKTPGMSRPVLIEKLKKHMSLSFSLGIVFLQYSHFPISLSLLQKAVEGERELLKVGSMVDKLWEGRSILYNTLAYLYQKAGQYKDALQYMYESHRISIEFKEAGGSPSADIALASNLTSFLILWKIQKFKEASGYLETSASIVNDIYNQNRHSKLDKNSVQNLYAIVVMSLAGLLVKIEHNSEKALNICSECLNQIQSRQCLGKRLLEEFILQIKTRTYAKSTTQSSFDMQSAYSDKALPPDLSENRKPINDWLVTPQYEDVVYMSLFIMHISPKTPLIRQAVLENKKNLSKKKLVSRDGSRGQLEKHWWELPGVLRKAMQPSSSGQSFKTEAESFRYKSEPKKRPVNRNGLPPLNISAISRRSPSRITASRRIPSVQKSSKRGILPLYHCIDPTTGYIESVLT